MNEEISTHQSNDNSLEKFVLENKQEDPEISRSLFYLGRALYRYSLLHKKGEQRES
jgi:hypothetical protein